MCCKKYTATPDIRRYAMFSFIPMKGNCFLQYLLFFIQVIWKLLPTATRGSLVALTAILTPYALESGTIFLTLLAVIFFSLVFNIWALSCSKSRDKIGEEFRRKYQARKSGHILRTFAVSLLLTIVPPLLALVGKFTMLNIVSAETFATAEGFQFTTAIALFTLVLLANFGTDLIFITIKEYEEFSGHPV